MGQIRLGCSGWSYDDWVGRFYPPGTVPGQMLTYYIQNFDTVEINSTFYRIPSASLVRNWLRKAPPGFVYSLKMYQGVTHEREMRSVRKIYDQYMSAVMPLRPRLGCILIQMPQRFKATESNYALLEDFLSLLHEDFEFAAEFRDRSWFNSRTFQLLENYNVAFCVVSQPQFKGLIPPEPVVTADHGYVRFHGLNYKKWYSGQGSERYDYLYSREELKEWKPKIEQMREQAERTVYVYFNNHPSGQAPTNAKMMMSILGLSPTTPKSAETRQTTLGAG